MCLGQDAAPDVPEPKEDVHVKLPGSSEDPEQGDGDESGEKEQTVGHDQCVPDQRSRNVTVLGHCL